MPSSAPTTRNRMLLLSNILFALAVIAAGVVMYLYFVDARFFNEHPTPPPCETGQNELICVVNALQAQNLDGVKLGRYTATSDQLSQPGQVIEIGDVNGFLFVYPSGTDDQGVKDRERDAANIDASTMHISARISERPLNDGLEMHIFQHSNIIFILVGGSPEQIAQVEAAINSLP